MSTVKRKSSPDESGGKQSKAPKTSHTKRKHLRKCHWSGPSEQLSLRRAATLRVEEKDSLAKQCGTNENSSNVSRIISRAATSRNTATDLDTVHSLISKEVNSRDQMFKIPSGLTKLALHSSETINTLNVAQSDLIDPIDDAEMASALESLKTLPTSTDATETDGGKSRPIKYTTEQTSNTVPSKLELEIAIVVCGDKKEIREKTKEFAKILLELIPETRVALVVGGDIHGNPDYAHIVSWIDFGATLEQIIDRVDRFHMQNGGVHMKAKDICKEMDGILSWTPGCPGAVFPVSKHVLTANTRRTVSKFKEELIQGVFPPHKLLVDYITDTNNLNREAPLQPLDKTRTTESTEKDSRYRIGAKVQTKGSPGPTDGELSVMNSEFAEEAVGQDATQKSSPKTDVAKRTKRNKQLVNVSGEDSPTSHQTVSRPRRHIRKPNKFSDECSFKMSKPGTTKKPAISTSNIKEGLKSMKQQLKTTKEKLQVKTSIKTNLPREVATDAQFRFPLMKYLKWTDWTVAVCSAIPRRHSKSDFKKPRNSNGFYRKISAEQSECFPSVLEFGVKLPKGRKVWAVCCMKHCQNKNASKDILDASLMRNNEIRKEIERVLKENCEVHLRWATPIGKDKKSKLANFEVAMSYIDGFDYAWARHGRNGHRRVLKSGIVLSDNAT